MICSTTAAATIAVRRADGFHYADQRDFLKHLDLEETANHQDTDQQGKTALGVECALLGLIAGD